MKHCPACQQVVPDDAKTCPHDGCGKSLPQNLGGVRVAPPPPPGARSVGASTPSAAVTPVTPVAASTPDIPAVATTQPPAFKVTVAPPPPPVAGAARLPLPPVLPIPPLPLPLPPQMPPLSATMASLPLPMTIPPASSEPAVRSFPMSIDLPTPEPVAEPTTAAFTLPSEPIAPPARPLPTQSAATQSAATPPAPSAPTPASKVAPLPLPPLPTRIALTEADRPTAAPPTQSAEQMPLKNVGIWAAVAVTAVLLLIGVVSLMKPKSPDADVAQVPPGASTSQPSGNPGSIDPNNPTTPPATPGSVPKPEVAAKPDAARQRVDLVFLIDYSAGSDKVVSYAKTNCQQYAEGLTNHNLDCRFGLLGFAPEATTNVPPELAPGSSLAELKTTLNAPLVPLPKAMSIEEALLAASRWMFREGADVRFLLVSNHKQADDKLSAEVVDALATRKITTIVFGDAASEPFYASLLPGGGRFHPLEKPAAKNAKLAAAPNEKPLDRLLVHWSFGEPKRTESKLAVAGLYALRTREDRREWLPELGGSSESEDAVEMGLGWLARHQSSDGHWGADGLRVGGCCKGSACPKAGGPFPLAQSGLALLAFQAGGHYEFNEAKYSEHVTRGLDWLVAQQKADGNLIGSSFYEHGIAAFALCEACAVAKAAGKDPNPKYLEAATKAVSFIEKVQHNDGGWRYSVNVSEGSDTSVSGWQVLALKTAREAGIPVSKTCIEKVEKYFKTCELGQNGRTGYVGRSVHTEATTGVGMLVHQFLLDRPKSQLVQDAAPYLAGYAEQNWPKTQRQNRAIRSDLYLWYNCTLAMSRAGGEPWNRWNAVLRDTLVGMQEKTPDTCLHGSWDDNSGWSGSGGRIYTTALAVLTLEVYYRFGNQSPEALVLDFKSEDPKKRLAAVTAARQSNLQLPGELLTALSDAESGVRQEARKALTQLSRGKDYGPSETATDAELKQAVALWRQWWEHEQLLAEFSKLPHQDLWSEFTSPDVARRWAAAESLRDNKTDSKDRLIALFADSSVEVRQAAHATLVQFAKGKDFGPSGASEPAAWEAAAKKWADWNVSEIDKQAAGKLRLAKDLIASGKREVGKKWLKEIIEQFPKTPTAKQAADLLKTL